MPTPIGTYTLNTVTNRILSRLGIDNPESELKTKIMREINFQVSKIAKSLKGSDKDTYLVEVLNITFTNNRFDLRTISDYDEFYTLSEDSFGDITMLPVSETNKLKQLSYWEYSFVGALAGDIVQLFVGSGLSTSGRKFNLIYYRLPIPVATLTDLIDLPDSFIQGLIDGVVATMPESKNKGAKIE